MMRTAEDVMTRKPKVGQTDMLAADILRDMTQGHPKITQLFLVDREGRPQGLVHLHDLLRIGLK